MKQQLGNSTSQSKIKCELCHHEAHDLLSHIRFTHKLSRSEYKGEIRSPWLKQQKSDAIKGSKNPGFQHGGRLSPFSKKGSNYDPDLIRLANSNRASRNNDTTKLSYWTERYGEVDGKRLYDERQNTFGLKKLIAKHGVEEGAQKWEARLS